MKTTRPLIVVELFDDAEVDTMTMAQGLLDNYPQAIRQTWVARLDGFGRIVRTSPVIDRTSD